MRYPFYTIGLGMVPREIIERARRIRSSGGYILTASSGERYGMIGAGPMPNPGYSIKIVDVIDGLNGPIITARIQPPRSDEVFIQIVSYPFLIGTIAQDTETITVHGLPKSAVEYI